MPACQYGPYLISDLLSVMSWRCLDRKEGKKKERGWEERREGG